MVRLKSPYYYTIWQEAGFWCYRCGNVKFTTRIPYFAQILLVQYPQGFGFNANSWDNYLQFTFSLKASESKIRWSMSPKREFPMEPKYCFFWIEGFQHYFKATCIMPDFEVSKLWVWHSRYCKYIFIWAVELGPLPVLYVMV